MDAVTAPTEGRQASFESLGLAPELLSAISKAGFAAPTEVQARCIPEALAGVDLMVSAQTGSGKTAAFMLAALHRLRADAPRSRLDAVQKRSGRGVQILVLTPTRELALQVSEAAKTYARDMRGLNIAAVVGGMPYGAQLRALSRRVDVLVATPGRLLDHVQSRRVDLSQVRTLVLDEADRMLDMGFIDDIETIVNRTPSDRQTLLFSATLDGTIAGLAARMMQSPKRIVLATQQDKHENIAQSLLYADDFGHKTKLLDHLLRDEGVTQAIIFTSTKRGADDLAARLSDNGFTAAALHGDMNQRQRNRTLSRVQRGHVQMLVATDVAARGIDVQGISHVVNFDLPMQAEDYVHRIGRTGRAGRSGLAYTLVTHAERHKVRRIEQYTGQRIPVQTVAGLEPTRAPDARRAGPKRSPAWRGQPAGNGGGRRGNKADSRAWAPRQADNGSWGRGGSQSASMSHRSGSGGGRRQPGASIGAASTESRGRPQRAQRSGSGFA